MAKYPLGPLLAARRFREDVAVRALRRAREAAASARAAAEAARAEWERYRAWRPGEEARLFETLRGRTVPLEEVDRHREDVQALRQAEQRLEEEARQAARAAEAADRAEEEARVRRAAAARDTGKIEAHRDRWRLEEARRAEAAEEAELEDFAPPKPADGADESPYPEANGEDRT